MKEIKILVGVVAGVIGLTATFGYVIDRPVWFHAEFVPVANEVYELIAENTSSKLQRAEEQKERRERRMEINRARGRAIEADDVEDLRYWKLRVHELKRKLKILDQRK